MLYSVHLMIVGAYLLNEQILTFFWCIYLPLNLTECMLGKIGEG